jgi:hypothetical protein
VTEVGIDNCPGTPVLIQTAIGFDVVGPKWPDVATVVGRRVR